MRSKGLFFVACSVLFSSQFIFAGRFCALSSGPGGEPGETFVFHGEDSGFTQISRSPAVVETSSTRKGSAAASSPSADRLDLRLTREIETLKGAIAALRLRISEHSGDESLSLHGAHGESDFLKDLRAEQNAQLEKLQKLENKKREPRPIVATRSDSPVACGPFMIKFQRLNVVKSSL